MKLSLNQEQKLKIKQNIIGAKVTFGKYYFGESKRELVWSGYISDFLFSDELKKYVAVVDCANRKEVLPFKKLLTDLYYGDYYKSSNKKLKDISAHFCSALKNNNYQEFENYLENLGEGVFIVESLNLKDDEVSWLDKHVTSISATFPKKYLKDFKKNFNTDNYTINEKSWNFGFTMHFDSLENMPESLKAVKNKNGNAIDFDKKLMYNTSYIWNLLKKYPDKFAFGKRELK